MPRTVWAKNHTIEEMQALARGRGGECLASEYINCRTKLRWRCARGHEWDATPQNILQGTWCAACAWHRDMTVEGLQKDAAKRGGRLISTEVVNKFSRLEWECAQGHRWVTQAYQVRLGHWCPDCAGVANLTIEYMREVARSHGGLCLSERYVNVHRPLRWQCAEGHVWKAAAIHIRRKPGASGTWCPECGKAWGKYTIEDMRRLAASRGGECLSNVFINQTTALRWRCARGHTWEALPNNVRYYSERAPGRWCAVCANIKLRYTIEQMKELARERGGECLSKRYRYSDTPLQWQCAAGHRWRASFQLIHQREGRGLSWCPVCEPRRT